MANTKHAAQTTVKIGELSTTVSAVLSNSSLCLSTDSSFMLSQGYGVFPGSVCEVVDYAISLSFQANSSSGVISSDSTNTFQVTGEIHLAMFNQDHYFWNGRFEQFIRDAIQDVNEGWFLHPFRQPFPGRTVSLKTYYMPEFTSAAAIKSYHEMKEYHASNPEKRAHAVIGFNSNNIAKIMLPLMAIEDQSVLSFRGDSSSEFSDKSLYPTFNRIIYSDEIMEYGFLLYLKERNWYKILVITGYDTKFTSKFYTSAKDLGIEIVKEFVVPPVADANLEPVDNLKQVFNDIKVSGIKVIVNVARGHSGTYLYTEAIRHGVTCIDGYQWVGFNNMNDFPVKNLPDGCHTSLDALCNLRFKGMTFNEPLYLVDGWGTREWDYVWTRNFRLEEEDSLSQARDMPFFDIAGKGAEFGLAQDVVVTYVLAMERMIAEKRTISGSSLALEIRQNTNYHGFTSQVALDNSTGDRLNYHVRTGIMWPNLQKHALEVGVDIEEGFIEPWSWETVISVSTNTIYMVSDMQTTTIIERKTDGGKEARTIAYDYNDFGVLTGYIELPDKYKNVRTFKAYKGWFQYEDQRQTTLNWDYYAAPVPIADEMETKTELVPASYYCSDGCGGNILDLGNIHIFENGVCVKQDTCQCSVSPTTGLEVWSGPQCEMAVCSAGCQKGVCVAPDNCTCLDGWSGVDCSSAICSSCTSGGQCISPETCVCNTNRFGPGCAGTCTCVNGECNGGLAGDGTCTTCDSGYIGGNCDISLVALILPTMTGFIVLVVGLYFLVKYFINRAKLKAALYNNDWMVNWNDLKRHDEATGRSSMFLSAMSMNNTNRERKQINTGSWEGMDVHYQKLTKDSLNVTDSIRLEVKKMRDMRHINIAMFVGCCVDAPNICILTELQPKGSLDDILTNEDIKLPWNFRFAILKGVCAGLDYLHKSEIKSHGRLKSTNCLIDNRWTVKLTGFGLHELKSGQTDVGVFDPHSNKDIDPTKANYGSLLWTAPEILRTGVYHIDHVGRGTVEGDIYSLGLIISEMCTRDFPFADVMLEKEEIVALICGSKEESIIRVWNDYIAKLNVEQGGWVRPCIKDKEWPSKYEKRKALKKLMESSWHEDPVHRPTLHEIKKELERIEPQRGELMDHLVTMLEKYSGNLEDIVAKRTKQLQKEKQKTEDLVSRLLPKSVAEELKQGRRVAPENFESVTIYFSDIVGFTSIAKASTPLQVVALLNDMYTSFDSIAANYDVYKVETIGDAYMIVSGLPTRNGDKHAGEICTTALDLMSAIGDFEIAHMKDTKLRLRAGVHTGNVVAGVVGLKMPRYCLFGDSVNVASKMESGGKPLRVHISQQTYTILSRLGGYKCEYRHEVEVKGLGIIKTYWLNGKDGYTKPLPEPSEED
ncbi:uncharacterized protein LOC130635645 isoform X2 [Hydractinia symbiolongicarpus]|uniref:uncharacterized protein LOC130635645 isoform X2 n=1 Tax=Hydractinia symbiolongicarpus TaxID=13093 RepID=UPI00254DD5CC|nr:uncharacterized protein LOC130635645 isoform X2 [Hydractinia symbiolongicarpus]